MTLPDRIQFAFTAMRGHRVRSILTLIGFGIGVAAVLLLTALGEGARQYVTQEFMALGSNLLIVLPGKTETTGNAPLFGGTPRDLTLGDMEAVRRHVPRIRRLAPLAVGSAQVGFGDRRREATVLGSTRSLLEVRHLKVASGEFLPEIDPDRQASVAVLGQKIQNDLFGSSNPLGQSIRIGDWRFRVIGVLESKGSSLGVNMDEVVLVPVASGLKIFNRSSLFRIMLEVGAHSELVDTREQVLGILKERHEGEEDVTVLSQDSVLTAFNRILGALTLSLAGIAAVSLAVAGIGIMNVMLVSVSERTSEVGLLKALGAKPRQILLAFLTEAGLLSAAGGLFGIFVGYLGVGALALRFPALPAQPPTWALLASIVVSLGAGLLFGVLPARRAARLDPVTALGSGH